ncbi:MAG: hypothetical protein JXA64_10145 [Candidatus Fermentibacteraceae bacterium]|nr:hypothetical protein [Candidatus Fermentibacteraceae bacterium]MBN2609461.1 hypothetical protein [Candidatus Fermentibacteraceae bacterium]
MSNVRIEMKTKTAQFTLSSGSEIEGQVYLSLYSINRSGSQQIDELLNEGDQFFPVKSNEGFVLLNRDHVMLVRAKFIEEEHVLRMMGEKHSVVITTLNQNSIEADVFVDLPRGYQRMKDYLNQPGQFLTLFQPEQVLYINRNYILYITD